MFQIQNDATASTKTKRVLFNSTKCKRGEQRLKDNESNIYYRSNVVLKAERQEGTREREGGGGGYGKSRNTETGST